MKSAIAILMLMLSLSACALERINTDKSTLQQLAPDVPRYSAALQTKAAAEIVGGMCPAMTTIVIGCSITRDQSRLLSAGQ